MIMTFERFVKTLNEAKLKLQECAKWVEWPACPKCGEKERLIRTFPTPRGPMVFMCDSCGHEFKVRVRYQVEEE